MYHNSIVSRVRYHIMGKKMQGYKLCNPGTIFSFILGILFCLTGAVMMFFDIGADPVRITFGIVGNSMIASSYLFGWIPKKKLILRFRNKVLF